MLSFSYDYQYALGFCFLLQFTLFVPFPHPPPPPLQGYVHNTPDSLSAATKGFCSHTRTMLAARFLGRISGVECHISENSSHEAILYSLCTDPPSPQEKSIFPEGRWGRVSVHGLIRYGVNIAWACVVTRSSPERCALRYDTKNDLLTGVAKFE